MRSLASTTAGKVEGRVENGIHVFRGIPFVTSRRSARCAGGAAAAGRGPGRASGDGTRFGPACAQPRT